jgi:hypothetical protein
VSQLDEKTYGPRDSLLTKEKIEELINGNMTAEEAVENKKLFMLDYHGALLPYVDYVRQLYGSRTLFFLTKDGTLKPIAIELTRPKQVPKDRQAAMAPRLHAGRKCDWILAVAARQDACPGSRHRLPPAH